MKRYYLYLKTHNKTGLKYLGKTIKDPLKYKGSGKYWTRHLKKHGNDVTTEILKECLTNDEVKLWGKLYSEKWDVENSTEFANLRIEEGDGGTTISKKDNHHTHTIERMREMSKARMIKLTPEQRSEYSRHGGIALQKKVSENGGIWWKNGFEDKNHTEEAKKRIGKAAKEHQTGKGNSQFGTHFYCDPNVNEPVKNRKRFKKGQQPSGWITTKEYRELNKI